ncbi:MAG: aspartate/glutamate racemase family protein [Ectothiorhodospiraceae bacterium]|nr:aspartate/glutamate racemase family protein [Chromatiales bacterium]MCP5154472.1 aspartate/glutamate racemase family protein [Ectothiorhodospiraceae bacterium]
MRTIGLIGGMSWESTAVYYRELNRLARERLGGLHSAEIALWSFDFAEIETLQAAGDWDGATARMVDAARRLERAGAGCLVICTNTMHRMAEQVQAAIAIPLVHIADATATAIRASGSRLPALLGTRYTMEQDFYKGRLRQAHGIEVLIPDEPDRTTVHDIIYRELCLGVVEPASRRRYLAAIDALAARGADGVILGCTEIGLLIGQADTALPVFDTTTLHAEAALRTALEDAPVGDGPRPRLSRPG